MDFLDSLAEAAIAHRNEELRDKFAGDALSGMLAFDGYSKPICAEGITAERFAKSAYELADAMLAERAAIAKAKGE